MEKYVYVILTRTLTISGKVIRKITGNSYSHASISLDKNFNEMYSFARFHYQNPIVGGFVHENVQNLSLGKNEEVYVKIFRIPVTNYQYRKLKRYIRHFKENEDKYMYNLLELIFFPLGIKFKIRDSYICTEFVMHLLDYIEIERGDLKSKRVTPAQLKQCLEEYEYYDGSLQNYISTVEHEEFDNHFLEKENIFFVIGKSIKQLGKLLFRKIT